MGGPRSTEISMDSLIELDINLARPWVSCILGNTHLSDSRGSYQAKKRGETPPIFLSVDGLLA